LSHFGGALRLNIQEPELRQPVKSVSNGLSRYTQLFGDVGL
jgi:hypothetical protein